MNYSKLVFGLMFILNIAFAQNTITGKVIATNTRGFTVIGCLIDLSTRDCNYEKSQYAEVNQDGTYTLSNLESGQYIIIAWRDTNSSGDLEEDQDEVGFYTDATGQVSFVTPPMQGINMTLGNTVATTNQSSSSTTSGIPNNNFVGEWSNIGVSASGYTNETTGSYKSANGSYINYTFFADGKYENGALLELTFYSCTTSYFRYETGTYTTQDKVVVLTPATNTMDVEDDCGDDYKRDYPLEVNYYYFEFVKDESTGEPILELSTLKLTDQGSLDFDPESPTPTKLYKVAP